MIKSLFARCASSTKIFTSVCFSRTFAMPKKALLLLAEGAEEMETVITVDILRRGGIDVTVAGVAGKDPVKCSRNVVIVPDTSIEEALKAAPYDVVILPGGLKGAQTLAADARVGNVLKEQEQSGRLLAAVCAAPSAFKSHGIALGKTITSHPSIKSTMEEGNKYIYTEARVAEDGQVITSRGPGTCFEFALAIVTKLEGEEKAKSLMEPMLYKH